MKTRLAHRQRRQQPPEVVPAVQLGKLTLARAIAKALEGTDRHVFLVECTAAMARQSSPRPAGPAAGNNGPTAAGCLRSRRLLIPCSHCVTDSPLDTVTLPSK